MSFFYSVHNVVQYKLFIFQYLSRQQNMGYAIFWNNEYFSWIYLTKFFAVLKLHTDTVHADFCSSEIAYGYRTCIFFCSSEIAHLYHTCRFLQLRNCTLIPYIVHTCRFLQTEIAQWCCTCRFLQIRNCTLIPYIQIFEAQKLHTDTVHADFCK